MIGDGELRETVESHARRLGVEQQIRITGFRSDVRPEISACDVVVLCSTTEALSLAALEAMAMGCPVVHSDVGGASEIIVPGSNGFLFPAGDLAAFTQQLALLADRRFARHLGRNARRIAEERFSERAMVDRYESTLFRLSTGRPDASLSHDHSGMSRNLKRSGSS
jgi:glycosyltransferase involved in cell wall biosynthesis